MHAWERIELDPVAGRGGRSWGRRLPRGSSSGSAWYWWCGFEFKLRTSFYRRSEGVAMNGIAPASNYGEAEVGQGI